MVELLVASAALALWLAAPPGPLKSVLYNLVLIGSISTVFFNGNPLLKFDGYYILSDMLEIPNLAQRSQAYIAYLFKRRIFGSKSVRSPVTADGERFWFLLYGPLASLYRIILTFSIALFLATQYMLVGVLLAGWSLIAMGVFPLAKGLYGLFKDQEMASNRNRMGFALVGMITGLAALLFLLPVPFSTIADGYVSVPENTLVRTEAEGFATRVVVPSGNPVKAGDLLLELVDPTLQAETRVANAEAAALRAEIKTATVDDAVGAAVLQQKLKSLQEHQKTLSTRKTKQRVLAPANGIFITPQASDLMGLLVSRGSVIGYIWSPERFQVSALLDQVAVGNVRNGMTGVDILSSESSAVPLPARIMLALPGGVDRLPHKALSTEGGGSIATDPRYPNEMRLNSFMFRIDLTTVKPPPVAYIGQRFSVRFKHDPKPLGFQIAAAFRRLLLDRFGL
jgi:putative peptide zinc metalloprotease protein